MAVGSVALGGLLFGTAGTAQAVGPGGTTPLGVGGVRLLVGGMVLLAVVMRQGKSPAAALRLWRSRTGLLAGVCVAAYQVCFFAGVQQTGVALGTLVTVGSAPILAGLLAWAGLATCARALAVCANMAVGRPNAASSLRAVPLPTPGVSVSRSQAASSSRCMHSPRWRSQRGLTSRSPMRTPSEMSKMSA